MLFMCTCHLKLKHKKSSHHNTKPNLFSLGLSLLECFGDRDLERELDFDLDLDLELELFE